MNVSNLTLQICISTMFGTYPDWIDHIPEDLTDLRVLIINQCDETCRETRGSQVDIIHTPTRGLSVSRNIAVSESQAEWLLISDNDIDIRFDALRDWMAELPQSDLDIYVLSEATGCVLSTDAPAPLTAMNLSSAVSWQIALRRAALIETGVTFDERFGLGAEINNGEENILLADLVIRHDRRGALSPHRVVATPDMGTGYLFGPGTLRAKRAIFTRMYGTGLGLLRWVAFAIKNAPALVQGGAK